MKRHLDTLERLLEVPGANLEMALTYAADLVAVALAADKVDAFLYDPTRDSLVAMGSSNQPLSASQRRHGLDVLAVANGGRVAAVYESGVTFATGHLQDDPEELRGIKEALNIESEIGVPLYVGGVRRGVLLVASLKRDLWDEEDTRFTEAVARWVSIIAHRAELSEELAKNSLEQGRRAAAEELITVMAHDLRNYIAPIDLRLTVLRRRAQQDGRRDDEEDLDRAFQASRRLAGIISDLLDVARIEGGVLEVRAEPTALVSLVEEIAKGLATPEHAINVKAAEELVVRADQRRVRQCVENLLANASKHSPKDAPVTVTVSRLIRERDQMARVDIIDEGPGVPTEMSPHIFERFVTGARSEGGLGLGLYFAKQIARLHGGDLTLESNPGQGARFCLLLPIFEGDTGV